MMEGSFRADPRRDVKLLILNRQEDIRTQLLVIREMEYRHILIMSKSANTDLVLEQGRRLGILAKPFTWLFLNLVRLPSSQHSGARDMMSDSPARPTSRPPNHPFGTHFWRHLGKYLDWYQKLLICYKLYSHGLWMCCRSIIVGYVRMCKMWFNVKHVLQMYMT